MQVKMKVRVSAHDFYSILTKSLMDEIKTVTGKTVSEKDLEKGFRYKKKSNQRKGVQIKVHVQRLVPDQEYKTSFTTNENRTIMHYEFAPIKENSCFVTYTEEYTRLDNQKERTSLFHSPKARAKKMIRAVEQYIIKQKKASD